MSHVIRDVASHEAALKRAADDNSRIMGNPDWEMSESGLSIWANNANVSFNRQAIDWLKLGEEHGIDGPAADMNCLVFDGKIVEAHVFWKSFNGHRNASWVIHDDEVAEKFGRKFIPAGENSRIQKNLGLSEERRVVPISNNVKANCAFVGAPMVFSPLVAWSKMKEDLYEN